MNNRKRTIAIVSKADSSGGGASVIAERHARLLVKDERFECHHWLSTAGNEWRDHYRKLHGNGLCRFTWKAINWFSIRAGYPDFFTPEILTHLAARKTDYDIYHFHDLARAVSPLTFRWISKRKPVVHTLHDCSTFTGGCLYPMDCEAFHDRCTNCPQLDVWPLKPPFDRTGWMQDYKRQTASQDLFVAVTPSNWMADEAMKSGMFKQRPTVIPNCVDSDTFRPQNKRQLREKLGLQPDRFMVLLNVYWLADERKGIRDAIEAIRNLPNNPLIIAIGRVMDDDKSLFDGLDAHFTGFLTNRSTVADFTAASDVLLYPTFADNLPNTVLEAMACGTPTIGYDVGGMTDMITDGENGYLVPPGDKGGLSRGLEFAQSHPQQLADWSTSCRSRVETGFTKDRFVESHAKLYDQVLDNLPEYLPHLVSQE